MNYKWKLTDYPPKNGLKVFSTFACGGGSTMGYKLAGYDVIGANDIDPQMAKVYKTNHNPSIYILAPIGDLLKMELPKALYELDILDGSPPCSTFSMAGSREENWGENKQFREGQAEQILDDLFFDFIALAKKLQPKVIVAENVKGMLAGNAKGYLVMIKKGFENAGYNVQLFCLNGASMGVPQKRERVFFICSRKDLNLPPIRLSFNEQPITFGEVEKNCSNSIGKILSPAFKKWWDITPQGKSFSYAHPKGSFFNTLKVSPYKVLNTITATNGAKLTHHSSPNEISTEAIGLCGSFPTDYNYMDLDPKYLIGMSVPPLMIGKIAEQIYKQWYEKR